MYLIEMCCTGNNGRSKIAEAIGDRCVKEKRLEDRIKVISSGTEADVSFDNVWSYRKAAFVFECGVRAGFVKDGTIDKQKYMENGFYQTAINTHAREALLILRQIEAALRNAALYEVGLKCTELRTQTVSRGDVTLALGMDLQNTKRLNDIYTDNTKTRTASTDNDGPIILKATTVEVDSIEGYAVKELQTGFTRVLDEVPNGLGNVDVAVYRKIREKLELLTPKVIDKFLSKHAR